MGVVPPASSSLSKSIQKVSMTATCRLEWNYQLSKINMAFSLSNIEIHPGRHLMGVLECHQLTPPNKIYDQKKKVQSSGHWLEINTESEYNSNLQIGMALSIK